MVFNFFAEPSLPGEQANVTWRFRGERAGFLGTQLLITPHGRDFWTTMHLSGTIDEPKQDLSPRIIELFKGSPGAYLGLLFRQFEGWLKKAFGSD